MAYGTNTQLVAEAAIAAEPIRLFVPQAEQLPIVVYHFRGDTGGLSVCGFHNCLRFLLFFQAGGAVFLPPYRLEPKPMPIDRLSYPSCSVLANGGWSTSRKLPTVGSYKSNIFCTGGRK
ncbi:hypothetical protein SAMN05444682_11357 [Parapedobacter indicus]|uniref:Uncharacterized protein n=1 Tax=Parapedobacter indicus TaxID=1477437 RepID=A0A1I3TV98_9SPHI|nr:hypothetical protein CLV26_11357 [Parapedobacter indicus]SFJ73576.1 hypothetical protein SAMN05444682_11357 [Parapedobacter indicus]